MTVKRICLQPFNWLELQPDGSLFGCCPSWRPQPLGNLLQQSLDEIWQGPAARGLRAALRRGEFPGCRSSRCPHLATGSGPVRPQTRLSADSVRRLEAADEAGPEAFKLSFDQRCNLSCPSCRDRVVPDGFEAARAGRLLQRVTDELLPRARALTLAGHGDPFAAPCYTQLLLELEQGVAPELQALHLHTNAQLWTRRRWQRYPRLQSLLRSAEISVDAASAATYAANRRGGVFERLLENLEYVAGLGIDVQLSCVVQENNLHELEAFSNLAVCFGFRCYFSRLDNWGSFSGADYTARAVHLPGHPRHAELCERLQRLSAHPHVALGNLAPLLSGAL